MIKTLRTAAVAALLGATALAGIGTGTAHADTDGQPTTATIKADADGPVYHKEIFTQFAEHLGNGIYGGLYVGKTSKIPNTDGFRNDVIAALRELNVPVIRWPGGCFADEYHWREGIGPQKNRPVKVNTHWGGVTEPNTVGTDEYFDLLRLVGAQAYVSGNVGDAPPREMAEWVEYMTAPAGTLADERAGNGHKAPYALPFFGIGNELWGCGGNMRPEYAADVTRRYATFVKVPDGTRTLKIASGANVDDYAFTEAMMRIAGNMVDGLSLHYYVLPEGGWPPHSDPVNFGEQEWADALFEANRMDELITKHSAIMDKYDPKKRVMLAVDEWGAWYKQDPDTHPGFLRQQNTLRDAMIASTTLDIFAKHADRVRMSAIAQMVNVLQAMILTDGSKMVKTPTYWVYDMYKPWQDATVLPLSIDAPYYAKGKFTLPAVSGSAVKAKDGAIHVALSNLDPEQSNTVTIALDGVNGQGVSGTILTAGAINAHNTFDNPDAVKPVAFEGAKIEGGKLVVTLPAKSIVALTLR
ncbi:alpha-N-arabinofuranosidase [Novosphingobium sp. 1949]|uniref:non-reducing end alpha-L-arabinofuranosidase n=1 Tax=Novosphingobium organovorum TaxID=2930092 RepID=A0ABT0BCI4_9SPHN|nr:alpha-L-arabinofuranosidase C-terminal domain-containing protein [Novosphingobium organovorum]MCJ2182785.1 alpha-N-arabinofuranosidase [Novosphingobium organovorum]